MKKLCKGSRSQIKENLNYVKNMLTQENIRLTLIEVLYPVTLIFIASDLDCKHKLSLRRTNKLLNLNNEQSKI